MPSYATEAWFCHALKGMDHRVKSSLVVRQRARFVVGEEEEIQAHGKETYAKRGDQGAQGENLTRNDLKEIEGAYKHAKGTEHQCQAGSRLFERSMPDYRHAFSARFVIHLLSLSLGNAIDLHAVQDIGTRFVGEDHAADSFVDAFFVFLCHWRVQTEAHPACKAKTHGR
ncbi:hypothetical protein [Prosthecobacter sp.]|uniref:hypothetical protein n=1 Tax=Prosthecobacter sp. TaxID=1965333 RepID=UPI00378363EE